MISSVFGFYKKKQKQTDVSFSETISFEACFFASKMIITSNNAVNVEHRCYPS